jgi:hypothetical protein
MYLIADDNYSHLQTGQSALSNGHNKEKPAADLYSVSYDAQTFSLFLSIRSANREVVKIAVRLRI